MDCSIIKCHQKTKINTSMLFKYIILKKIVDKRLKIHLKDKTNCTNTIQINYNICIYNSTKESDPSCGD